MKNVDAHVDIEKEIKKRNNGLFTCVVRVNSGNIVDVVIYEYGTIKDYTQLSSSSYFSSGSGKARIWTNYYERRTYQRSGTTPNTQSGEAEKEEVFDK